MVRPAYERPVSYRQEQARESYRQGWGENNPDRRDGTPAPHRQVKGPCDICDRWFEASTLTFSGVWSCRDCADAGQ